MTYANTIYNLLIADDDLTDLVQVFNHSDIPAEGVSRDTFPQAFDTNGILAPYIVVKGRGNIPNRQIVEVTEKISSTRQIVEVWIYDDRDEGWDTIHQAANICYGLLHDEQIEGSFNCTLFNEIDEERDPDQGGACFARQDYAVIGLRTASV